MTLKALFMSAILVMLASIQGCEDRGGVCEPDPSFTCWRYGTREGNCTQVGCIWKEGCAPIRCSTTMTEATCQALDHCYWAGGSCSVSSPNARCDVKEGGACDTIAGCAEGFACFGEVDCAAFNSIAECSDRAPLCRWRQIGGPIRTGQSPQLDSAESLMCALR